jgi:hypothetical protein
MQRKQMGIINVDFDANRSITDNKFCIRKILEKNGKYKEVVRQIFIDFEKAYDSVRREIYHILIEFGVRRKLVRLIKMCLSETYTNVHVGKNLSDTFPIRNGLKK